MPSRNDKVSTVLFALPERFVIPGIVRLPASLFCGRRLALSPFHALRRGHAHEGQGSAECDLRGGHQFEPCQC